MPVRAICGMVNKSDPYTMAFGGVATGSMKAALAASVAGTVSKNGFCPIPSATEAMTGKKAAMTS